MRMPPNHLRHAVGQHELFALRLLVDRKAINIISTSIFMRRCMIRYRINNVSYVYDAYAAAVIKAGAAWACGISVSSEAEMIS